MEGQSCGVGHAPTVGHPNLDSSMFETFYTEMPHVISDYIKMHYKRVANRSLKLLSVNIYFPDPSWRQQAHALLGFHVETRSDKSDLQLFWQDEGYGAG